MPTNSELLWPDSFTQLSFTRVGSALAAAQSLQGLAADLKRTLPLPLSQAVAQRLIGLYTPLANYSFGKVSSEPDTPFILGINGAQGSGKSLAAVILQHLLQGLGVSVCQLSIDDVYLERARRLQLAEQVHPLLATRGVPGTHDVPLALDIFAQLRQASVSSHTQIPRFNKATDDRHALSQWDTVIGRPQVIIFEGWCIGAQAQPSGDLRQPINRLEREQDSGGIWRGFVNDCLHQYQALFQQLDMLIMLKAPSFAQVLQWRLLQEQQLRHSAAVRGVAQTHIMQRDQVTRFVAHYERLTRWMLQQMPARADILFHLEENHNTAKIECPMAYKARVQ